MVTVEDIKEVDFILTSVGFVKTQAEYVMSKKYKQQGIAALCLRYYLSVDSLIIYYSAYLNVDNDSILHKFSYIEKESSSEPGEIPFEKLLSILDNKRREALLYHLDLFTH